MTVAAWVGTAFGCAMVAGLLWVGWELRHAETDACEIGKDGRPLK